MSKVIHKCIVEGDYFAKEAGGKVIKRYELQFNVPDLGVDKTDAHYMSVIKKTLLNKQLKAKYPNAITYRTHEMVDRIPTSPQGALTPQVPVVSKSKSVNSMNKTELVEYVAAETPEIDIEIYNTVDKLRKSIMFYQDDKEAFLKEQADTKAQIELDNALNALNPAPPADPSDPNAGTQSEGDNGDGE